MTYRSDIETLTEEERLTLGMCGTAAEKALRIIDAQAKALAEARADAEIARLKTLLRQCIPHIDTRGRSGAELVDLANEAVLC